MLNRRKMWMITLTLEIIKEFMQMMSQGKSTIAQIQARILNSMTSARDLERSSSGEQSSMKSTRRSMERKLKIRKLRQLKRLTTSSQANHNNRCFSSSNKFLDNRFCFASNSAKLRNKINIQIQAEM